MPANPDRIENPGKIGIGTWDADKLGSAIEHVEDLGFGWYYNWRSSGLWNASPSSSHAASFIPMIWDERNVTSATLAAIASSQADALLAFNEPNKQSQADMTVAQAIALWPDLMATGKRLGSPAVTTAQTLGSGTWLDQFMSAIETKDYRVDFIAVHYYSDDLDVAAFKSFLEAVHAKYGRPIWVTEWAAIDWTNPGRFTAQEIAEFAREATLMLDDLAFVERHAWFSAYDDGSQLHTEIIDASGNLTEVGRVFADLVGLTGTADAFTGTNQNDRLSGSGASDTLKGGAGDDIICAGKGNDVVRGGAGADILRGDDGNDTLHGGWDDDRLIGGAGKDTLDGGAGLDTADYCEKTKNVSVTLTGSIAAKVTVGGVAEDTVRNIENVRGGSGNDSLYGDGLANFFSGNDGDDLLAGGAGNDRLVGGAGIDKLIGGTGADWMEGGAGNDVFVFNLLADSGTAAATRDRIFCFAVGDRIDISAIDAIAGGADNAFVLDTDTSFSAGELRQTIINGSLVVELNVNSNQAAELSFALSGYTSLLGSSDFIL